MTEAEIIDKVYADTVEQQARTLLQELMVENPDNTVRHENAERRFRYGLKAAMSARDRAKVLIEGTK
jgi:hypothetical protein